MPEIELKSVSYVAVSGLSSRPLYPEPEMYPSEAFKKSITIEYFEPPSRAFFDN